VRNPHFPLADIPVMVCLAWEAHNLPFFVKSKMPDEGTQALGIEPANCHMEGRAAE
jgi:hypothetical protein